MGGCPQLSDEKYVGLSLFKGNIRVAYEKKKCGAVTGFDSRCPEKAEKIRSASF